MRIDLELRGQSVPAVGTLSIDFDPETIHLTTIADTARILLDATTVRIPTQGIESDHTFPILTELNGYLYFGQHYPGIGASLEALSVLPMSFELPHNEQGFALSFRSSTDYIQHMDDLRASQSSRSVTLGMMLWGTVLLVSRRHAATPTEGDSSLPLGSRWIDIGQIASLHTKHAPYFQVSRSRWFDLLEQGGFPQRRRVELPRPTSADVAPELKLAAQHLETAWSCFARDEFRQAVQMCRQCRDALLTGDKTTWAARVLAPVLGQEYASMIDESIGALKHLGHSASHGQNPVHIDRETAEYAIGQLSLILSYIDRKLR